MRKARLGLLLTTVALLTAPAAQAATVSTTVPNPPNIPKIIFNAANGENNNLSISTSGQWTVFTDSGASLSESDPNCEQVSSSTVRCNMPRSDEIVVNAGDGNDDVTDETTRRTSDTASSVHVFNLGSGDDVLDAGDGHNDISAGSGNDTIQGGAGYDVIRGEDGNDALNGNGGQDTIEGGPGDNTINGQASGDYLVGGQEDDALTGGPGIDEIWSGAGGGVDLIETIDGVADLIVCITAGSTANRDAIDVVRACGSP